MSWPWNKATFSHVFQVSMKNASARMVSLVVLGVKRHRTVGETLYQTPNHTTTSCNAIINITIHSHLADKLTRPCSLWKLSAVEVDPPPSVPSLPTFPSLFWCDRGSHSRSPTSPSVQVMRWMWCVWFHWVKAWLAASADDNGPCSTFTSTGTLSAR